MKIITIEEHFQIAEIKQAVVARSRFRTRSPPDSTGATMRRSIRALQCARHIFRRASAGSIHQHTHGDAPMTLQSRHVGGELFDMRIIP